jgi:hypothetical protein
MAASEEELSSLELVMVEISSLNQLRISDRELEF